MKIGFVVEPYEETHASGMAYVLRELITNFSTEAPQHEYVYFSSKPINHDLIPGTYKNVLIPKGYVAKFFYFFFLKEKVDVLMYMAPMLSLPHVGGGAKMFTMCQELGSQKIKPGTFKEKVFAFMRDQVLTRISFARGVHIIAASEATKDDIVKFYNISPQKITVSYDGYRDLRALADGSYKIPEDMRPYFFFTGKVKYRKNVHNIVAAFIAFKERTSSPAKLVISGDYGGQYYDNMQQELAEHDLQKDVFFLGYSTDQAVSELYKGAIACVFPSINEGFGMPIIEAMSFGTPVLTSKISSMAEVAGDAAILVDPFSVEEISQGMEKLYLDKEFRENLIQKGHERVKMFSWPKAAKEYIEIVEKYHH